jgi:hypothetical protein
MPAVDQNNGKPKVRATPKAKPAPKVRVTVPDAHDTTRTRRMPTISPDQADRERSPQKKTHDAQVVAKNVRESRQKYLRKQGRGSGTRAVVKAVKEALHTQATTAAPPTMGVPVVAHKNGGGAQFAAIRPVGAVKIDRSTAAGRMGLNVVPDAAELLVTTPSSVAKLASTAVTHPKKVPGMLAASYINLAKHPVESLIDHPVSTALMLQPAVRMPGRAAGKVARVAGKQTLERPAATVPGTAMKEARTGSRDVVVRAAQSHRDKKNPPPVMSTKDVQRRVDEHVDQSKHEARRIESRAVRAAKKATKGQPRDVRRDAMTQAREHAREVADAVAGERFAHEFGANGRLSSGAAVREFAHRERAAAIARHGTARAAVQAADAAHEAALTAARAALAKARTSPKLAALERRRRDAQRDLATAQRAHATARAELGVAKGRAEVLSRNVGGGGKAGGYGVSIGQRGVDTAGTAVKTARDRIRDLDQQISVERQRIRGVPPAQHQALVNAIHARGAARATLATARAEVDAARQTHIAAKVGMRNATIVQPAGEGRLFAHKADAAVITRKLNEHAAASGATDPVTFVVRQVGDDKWAAVPKVAANRLMKHHAVGSSPAVMAKVMRRSRGAFTQAVLPLSPKWLAGQGAEAGIRALVAGAGPLDYMRMSHVVKRLNKHQAGLGDQLMDRVTGGQFDLSGPARDFAHGKSLADEFEGTSLAKPAAAVTRAANTAPAKAVRYGWSKYTNTVLHVVNGAIENTARKAMAGQAIKNSPLIERHIIGLSDAALTDAAKGLRGTHNQVALGRAVDRMYGRYSKFSPEKRSLLLHWTPFLPWYLNVATFLFKVLPADHPVTAALLADASEATEQWRKDHGLSLRQGGRVPDFLLGSYPASGDRFRRVAHYTPFGIGSDVAGSTADLTLPQVLGPIKNLAGVDWKWQRLARGGKHGKEFNQGERAVRALVTAAEEQVPGVSQAGAISGLTPRYVDKDNPESIKPPKAVLKGYLPTSTTASSTPGTTSSGSSERVKVPGASGRIKVPGVTGRIKVP